MPPNSKDRNALNEKLCWDLWWEKGTLENAVQALTDMGIISGRTGKPVTTWGLEIAAWRYAVRHIDAAKEDFRKDAEKRNVPFDEQEEEKFYLRMMRASRRVFSVDRLREQWIAENNLEKYRKFLY